MAGNAAKKYRGEIVFVNGTNARPMTGSAQQSASQSQSGLAGAKPAMTGWARPPYPADLIAWTLLALLHETSAEVARSKHDPKIRAQIGDPVARHAGIFPRPLSGPSVRDYSSIIHT
jgi:hypothetical protein